jgi:hypothetical protein
MIPAARHWRLEEAMNRRGHVRDSVEKMSAEGATLKVLIPRKG